MVYNHFERIRSKSGRFLYRETNLSIAFLATKLFIPAPSSCLVERARLLNRLDDCLRPGCRLTLVSAPAGFGKTMLASGWIRVTQLLNRDIKVAWVTLDQQDNDSNRFWSYVVAAFQTFDNNFGKDAQLLLSSGQISNIEPAQAILINELALTSAPILLVLDDFHFIDQEMIIESLAFLLERLPANVHIMILTRSDPRLPLARLRSRNQLLEIRLADLRFSLDETNAFLNNAMGLHLTPAPIETLHAKTEGWVAGLQMAGIALQRISAQQESTDRTDSASNGPEDIQEFVTSFSGSNRFILDYLLEEVLRRQPIEIQTFLLKTSILEKFCAPLCDAIIENLETSTERLIEPHQSQAVLEYLERENLFLIPLDSERCWYRYHQLFADLLRKRLHQLRPLDEQELHACASRWFEGNQLSNEAVEHAFQALDYGRAARLLEDTGETILKHGKYQWLLQWIQRIPTEQLHSHWKLYLYQATVLASVGQLSQAEQSLQDFEKHRLEDQTDTHLDHWLIGQIATVKALIAIFRGDPVGSRSFAQLALESISPDSDNPWRAHLLMAMSHINQTDGNYEEARQNLIDAIKAGRMAGDIYMNLDATTHMVMMLCSQGQLKQGEEFAQQGLQYIEQFGLGRSAEAGMLFLGWGFLLCEQHKLEEAGEYIQRGLNACRVANIPGMLGWAYYVNTRYLMAKREWTAAEEATQAADRLATEGEIPAWIESSNSALRTQIWIRNNKTTDAERYLRDRGILPDGDIKNIQLLEYTVMGSLLLKKGELEQAEKIIKKLIQRAETKGHLRLMILNQIQLALLYQAKKDQTLAVQTLERALELSEPDGYIQLFIDESESLSTLLKIAESQGSCANFIKRIGDLTASKAQTILDKRDEPAEQPSNSIVNQFPLSQREIEVLRLLGEGLSNKEIAQQLYISLRTVKYHTTSIFTKLNVSNRTQAVIRGKAMGVL
jgi:LuxR family transcriptional regulator, maltose regulon positive regulatory protein